ncbi:MAG: PepSY domain-containing protein [Fluviicoccus sp.]|uniref:PepSY domain-containing protein n=1 Tax=Fluviicoccus sp. TaxID=2003552 RepID=UPI00271AA0E4|nr:PepSY domain-containing protein [Fluviicoccus sp.]MDO8329228.1 PepSY domain-containing protein [Fluviicoccus sp.]
MSKRSHWRFFLLRWHRRIGVVLGLYLLWMAGSGILLNHAGGLGLDKQFLEGRFWLNRYGVSAPLELRVGEHDFLLSAHGLMSGNDFLGECALFLGVMPTADSQVLACDNRILLLTTQGELIEQIDAGRGLPGPFNAMAGLEQRVFLRQSATSAVLELDTLAGSLKPVPDIIVPDALWSQPVAAPAGLTGERLLQDLHSGRLFGRYGPWVVDALGLSVIMLAISGWALARKRHPKM